MECLKAGVGAGRRAQGWQKTHEEGTPGLLEIQKTGFALCTCEHSLCGHKGQMLQV